MTAPVPVGDPVTDAPPSAAADDAEGLLREVDYYQRLPRLGPTEFDRYVKAAVALENMINAEAARRSADFEYAHADELLAQVVAVNTTLRGIAEREIARADPSPSEHYTDYLCHWRDAADGVILLVEGVRLTNRADERRLASDFEGGEQHLKAAMEYFGRLAGSKLPQRALGARRYTLAQATVQLLAGLQELRIGDFRAAYRRLDDTHVALKELLTKAEEEDQHRGDRSGPQASELWRDLTNGLRYVEATQSFVELLREAHVGNYRDAVVSGREAVGHFERILNAVASRNARALYEMELARVQGWLAWTQAELAVDESQWTDCREQIRRARAHWNKAARIAARNVSVGITNQRPEIGDTDMLLQGTLRRCDREAEFREKISTLQANLERARNIHILAQGGNAMSAESTFNFHGNVAANSIGNQNEIRDGSVQQNVGAGDFRELADQLAELHQVMASVARTPAEREAVAAVSEAGEAARRDDESAVRRNLARTGRWALKIAEQLALTAATAAITRSLGG